MDDSSTPVSASLSSDSSRFPRTQWSVVLRARDTREATEASKALSLLCETYWYPLYGFARTKGYSEHDAKDLTQGFFLYVLEHNLFGGADPDKGKLRTFLLTLFQRYLIRDYRKNVAERRGGGRAVESLDQQFEEGERAYRNEPAVDQDPVAVFTRAWATSVLTGAQELLRAEMATDRKSATFLALKPFLEPDRDEAYSYEGVAKQLGIRQDALRQMVSRMRKRYGELIRAQVADTLQNPTPEAIADEMRCLREAMGW
jgi:DNA-directed RNA polymerase specialized sigma24 family protein